MILHFRDIFWIFQILGIISWNWMLLCIMQKQYIWREENKGVCLWQEEVKQNSTFASFYKQLNRVNVKIITLWNWMKNNCWTDIHKHRFLSLILEQSTFEELEILKTLCQEQKWLIPTTARSILPTMRIPKSRVNRLRVKHRRVTLLVVIIWLSEARIQVALEVPESFTEAQKKGKRILIKVLCLMVEHYFENILSWTLIFI